jgi:integrase
MKGMVYPRPYEIVVGKDGKKRRAPVRGSTWTWQFEDKRGKTRSKGGFARKSDAQAALTEALAQHAQPGRVEPSKMTLAEYLRDEWLPVVRRTKKPTTAATYAHYVEKRIIPALGDIRLADLTPGDLMKFYDELRQGGRCDSHEGGLSERTIKGVHLVISASQRHALENGLVMRNAATAIPKDAKPTPQKKIGDDMHVLTPDELRAFLASVKDDRLYSLFAFASVTGMRRGELLALKWDDIDLPAGQVSIRRGLTAAGAEVHEGTTKSGHARTIAIDPETVALLKSHSAAQAQERLRAGELWFETGRVFADELGESLRPGKVSQTFDRRVRRAGLGPLRLHDLRHTHASHLLQAGVHPKVVQERLGHSSIAITLDIYSHLAPGMQEDAAALIGSLILGGSR